MVRQGTRLSIAILLFVTVFALASLAQKDESTGKSGSSVTGCVQKGEEPNGYTLKSADGKIYELTGDDATLGDHVGHTVTVTGIEAKASKSEEKKKGAWEKKESAGGNYTDFKVAEIKMVSDTCK